MPVLVQLTSSPLEATIRLQLFPGLFRTRLTVNKTGTGILTLSGAPTFASIINVNSGTLSVSGSLDGGAQAQSP